MCSYGVKFHEHSDQEVLINSKLGNNSATGTLSIIRDSVAHVVLVEHGKS
jgi:hypothetical protein